MAVEAIGQPDAYRSVHQITWDALPKCGAKTRSGRPCRGLVVTGRRRCRMHGGAAGSGAPLGNRNAWRHGRRSRDARERRLLMRLVEATSAALDAELRVLDVVAQGEVEQFDAVVQLADDQRARLQQAAVALERQLVASGRGDDARALADEVAGLVITDIPSPTS